MDLMSMSIMIMRQGGHKPCMASSSIEDQMSEYVSLILAPCRL